MRQAISSEQQTYRKRFEKAIQIIGPINIMKSQNLSDIQYRVILWLIYQKDMIKL